ncbi:MAG TPA: hypothetical protein VF346_09235 [Bacteroidales bacterium]
MKKILILCFTIILILTGCKKYNNQNKNSSEKIVSKSMLINNSLNSLKERISFTDNTPAYIFGDTTKKTLKNGNEAVTSSVTIQLIAALSPPEYNGEILQASHVRIVDHYAYVSYNTQGPRYLGGVDIVDISSPNNPEVVSSVIFINEETNKGKDVSSLDVKFSSSAKSNTFLWITGADETRDSAFAERYELNSSNQFESDQSVNFSLKGYVGTDVRFYNDKVYVTSGTGGGLTILDNQMKEVSFMNMVNARSVDVNKDFEIALGGNPGHLYNPGIWDKEIGGAADPEAKSIIRLYNKFALVALGEEGLKCYDVSSNKPSTVISALPRPAVPEGGSPGDFVTNGVSVSDNGWVYIANGAGGLDIAKIDADGKLTWMGNVDLGASVNFVEANANYVFVARGVRGLKILKVTEN